MALKRGSERESCDFCHRRKVKCDRAVRAKQGLKSCTQCVAREADCRLDDSDDIRIRRRRFRDPAQVLRSLSRGADDDSQEPTPSSLHGRTVDTVLAEDSHGTVPECMNDLFSNDYFTLSNDSMLFLDQVFADELEWSNPIPMIEQQPGAIQQQGTPVSRQQEESTIDSSWGPESTTLGRTSVTAALSSYFNLAAPYLPILLEDAFWQDYHADRCSQSLIYAVACRGMPFTNLHDKWHLQQNFASKFRETFLTTRSTALEGETVRLDDLEALALMVDFEYDDSQDEPLYGNLGRLFLKHESLVLMTLQSRGHANGYDTPEPETMARAEERRMLLYWHVYGLDAFHCLDRKQISHIPDDIATDDEIAQHVEVKGYFDAILALAIIARKTTRLLCSASSRRRGVDPDAVNVLYDQLHHWRSSECPQYLRMSGDIGGNVASVDAKILDITPASRHIHLHQSVLRALELNCFMQIESCYTAYGIQRDEGMRSEVTAARVEYESLRSLQDATELSRWMQQHPSAESHDVQRPLVDLAPSVLRNIVAGMCNWACHRGIRLCGPSQLLGRHNHSSTPRSRNNDRSCGGEGGVQVYMDTARLLRDTAAAAKSHKDTARILLGLDEQRGALGIEAARSADGASIN